MRDTGGKTIVSKVHARRANTDFGGGSLAGRTTRRKQSGSPSGTGENSQERSESRLANIELPAFYDWARAVGAAAYGLVTPLGTAIGLWIRTNYNSGSTTASAVSGVFDSISAGILLYTGLVESLAHEFVFNPDVHTQSLGKLAYSFGCMTLGAGLMALLGRWHDLETKINENYR
ncbi:high-affinity Zn(2+) transporter zrt1 [Tulasnella sp. 419]|nr:high-affinity Zn(2+) transporter zrt1 [Tulasnella sp. 419]